MTAPTKRTTSVDVARVAGVSRTTVSFVLNNRADQTIPEETRQRVLEAARQLDYRPRASARSLAAGRSNVVLFSMPYLPISASTGRYAEQLAAALAERGLTMVAHLAGVHSRALADVCASVDASVAVSMEPFDPETIAALRRAGVAVVRSAADGGTDPNRPVGKLQAEHLMARGHTRIGYALPGQRAPRVMATERLHGVEQACADADIPPPTALTVDPVAKAAARAIAQWRAHSVTAVAAYNDETAMAVYAGVHELGLSVPEDLAVIGVDDIPTAALAVPPLTTVAFDLSNAARSLAEAVAMALQGLESPSHDTSARPHLVDRAST